MDILEFSHLQIILNHLGTPIGVGRYSGQRAQRMSLWRNNILALSKCANVAVKLGGLGIPFVGFASYLSSPPASSEQLAAEWNQRRRHRRLHANG